MSKIIRESCVLCAAKHIAQARVLLLETKKGYEFYLFALGHLAEGEDELVKQHPMLASMLRGHRKKLEEDHEYHYPFKTVILAVAVQGEVEVEKIIMDIETSYDGLSEADLKRAWTETQS